MEPRDIIAIGASAGGVDAIQRLTAKFPADLPASVFITLHVSGRSQGILPDLLNKRALRNLNRNRRDPEKEDAEEAF